MKKTAMVIVFEVNKAASGDPQPMTVKSGKLDGYFRTAFVFDDDEDWSDPQ